MAQKNGSARVSDERKGTVMPCRPSVAFSTGVNQAGAKGDGMTVAIRHGRDGSSPAGRSGPDVSANAAYSRADCDTGGTERHPVQRSEVAHFKEHRRTNAPSTHVTTAARLAENSSPGREEHSSPVCVPLSCGTIIRKLRIIVGVEFIETPAFTARVADYLDDDEYRALQLFLDADPEAGDAIPGTGGFRKAAMGGSAPRQGQAWWPQGDLLLPLGSSDLADDTLRQRRNGRPARPRRNGL